jgi:hypothetical protein
MALHDTKYGVHQKMAGLQSQITALEQAHHALKAHLLGELQMYLDANCHGMNGKDGRNGVDGATGATGPKGDQGDVLVYGTEELQAAVSAARAKLVEQHARVLAAVDKAISEHTGSHPAHKLIRTKLEAIKRDAGL